MKILIIGIHDFVGSNLVKTLCVDNEIYGLDIVSPENENERLLEIQTEGTFI